MIVIGIVGGVASGKSQAARFFEELGAKVLDGDRAGHEVLRQPEVIEAARGRWGEEILDADGQIIRQKVAKIVFAPNPAAAEELRFLEELSHPRISEILQRQLCELNDDGQTNVTVIDAALLLKAGWDRFCDVVVFIDVPRQIRKARAAARGWDASQFYHRECTQESIETKRSRADFIIDNAGSPDELKQQIHEFWDSQLAPFMPN